MKRRIVSIKHPAKKSYRVIALSIASLMLVSGFSVLEPKAAENDKSIIDEIVSEAIIEAPVKREAPFDYETRMPSVKQVSSDQKDITFYRDDYAVKAKLMLPQGSGPYKTIVMRGEFGGSYSEYDGIAKFLNQNGYATLQVKNTHESEIVKRSGGSGSKIFADVYFEQVLDHFAVIDEMRYIPEIDMDNIYLWGHDLGGIISLYTGIERSDEIKGMIVVQPLLNNFQSLEFSKDPELIVRLYDLLPDCTVPTVIMEPENGLLSASRKAVSSMPDGELILFEGVLTKYDHGAENNIGELTLAALKNWNR